ncbi:MAG: hypothetical protein IPM38_14275 [Ignavibacteria bacterium]|nr:hypothetical protein [Ignavibacteria bacterium]
MKAKDKVRGLTKRENLKAENDLLKMKLTAEFGMKEMKSDLPDELENEWLNNIYNFEKQFKDAKRISVYERLDKPEFKKMSDMNDEEISSELDCFFELMEKNNLTLNFLCDYNDRIKYEFITEEFFKKEIDDIRIDGMNTNFIYEDSHPNHEYDIKEAVDDFFKFFLDERFNEEHTGFIYLNDMISYLGKTIPKNEYIKILITFREEINPAGLDFIEFFNVTFDLEKKTGEVSGAISFSVLENGLPNGQITSEFKLNLIYDEFGFWLISKNSFP